MRKFYSFFSVILVAMIVTSCGRTNKKVQERGIEDIMHATVDVLADEKSSWDDVVSVMAHLVDVINKAASDEDNLKNRLMGQQCAYMAINLLTDKYEEFEDNEIPVDSIEENRIVSELTASANQWFYEDNLELPNFWRDHYYVSNKSSKHPVNGYFHLMLTMPTSSEDAPDFHIFYPDTAEDDPVLIFRKYKTDINGGEDHEEQLTFHLKDWAKKEVNDEGFNMHAFTGPVITKYLFDYDVLYLTFKSFNTPDGEPGESEMARLELRPLQVFVRKTLYP